MSARSRLRPLTAEEMTEAQAHAYAAHYLTGRDAVEVLDRMGDVMADVMAAVQRGDIEGARRLLIVARAGLAMVSESLTAAGARITVATSSPLLTPPPAG